MGFAIRSSLLGFKGLNFGTKTFVQCPAYMYQHIQKHYIKPRAITRFNTYLKELYCCYEKHKEKNLSLYFLN